MDSLALDGVVGQQFILGTGLLLLAHLLILQLRHLSGNIGEDKEAWILILLRQQVEALVCQLDLAILLIHDEVERIGHHMHLAVVVLHIEALGVQETLLHALGAEVLDQRLVLRQALIAAEEQQIALVHLLGVVACDLLLRLIEEPGTERPLSSHDGLDVLTELLKHLISL